MNHYQKIAEALTYLAAHAREQPDLDTLARHVGLSPFHFQRLFSEWAGVSPKKFLQYLTLQHAKNILSKPEQTLFDAAHETGLSGTGRLHDLFVNIESMTPGEYQKGKVQIEYSAGESIFGSYLVASTHKGICKLCFFDGSIAPVLEELQGDWPKASILETSNTHHEQVKRFLNQDFSDGKTLTLHLKGTPFQLKVWEALLKIPQGDLSTYSHVAKEINQPTASRAVGTAIGSNPIGFIIPCHRVIKSLGGIGEYRWGSVRKKAMIGWEASQKNP